MESEVVTRDIKGFEDYTIDTLGRVYSKKRQIYLKLKPNMHGYIQVFLSKNSQVYPQRAGRLVALAFISNPENKQDVDHINRNKTDNRLENLRWVTKSENQQNRGIQSNNKTGQVGISVKMHHGNLRYKAQITANKKTIEKKFPYTDDGFRLASEWYIYQKRILHIQSA